MFRKSIISVLVLFTIVLSPVLAKNNGEKVKHVKKTVLILKDSSDLEVSVSRILQDTLTKLGYTVKDVNISTISKENAASYAMSILFSAISPGEEIDTAIQKFISTKVDTSSKIFVYTVYGNVYKKDEAVDATTQATKELHPELIADHILYSLKPHK